MKNHRFATQKFGCSLFALLTSVAVYAQAGNLSGLQFENTGTDVFITGYTGSATVLELPEQIEGAFVTEISASAFRNNVTLQRIRLPRQLLFIRESAFQGCTALTAMTIPGSVLEVNAHAFADCINLRALTLEEGVIDLFPSSFRNTGLTRLVIPSTIERIEMSAFAGTPRSLEFYFLADSPDTIQANALGDPAGAFFFEGALGFQSPVWTYAAGESVATTNLGERTNAKQWLLTEHLGAAPLWLGEMTAPRPLFASYALNIDPLGGFRPELRIEPDGRLIVRYFAGRSDANYSARFSDSLEGFSADEVAFSGLDGGGFQEASVASPGARQFFQIEVRERQSGQIRSLP